ncbi:MAG: Holliday junction branch migration protein RuvA [Candidatus Sericytochromatia bacterium]|nr:Holliday junction branch migration protein RuvA [Candidatus Sericytochromatia bacterium]
MYNFVRGKVDEVYIDSVSVDVCGVGYLINISKRYALDLTPELDVKIFTTLIHREDTMKLYGFESKKERELFNMLNSVSGIGSKTALAILSQFDVSEVITSIYANDSKKLAKAPGIGIKTAQRLILELKEKISTFKSDISGNFEIQKDSSKLEQFEETEGALFALGYSSQEVSLAIKWLTEAKSELSKSDDMIRESLMWLSSN